MQIQIARDAEELGRGSAAQAAEAIRSAIRENGRARIVLSTGESQFTMFENLVREDVDWARVDMFHLDEYAGLPDTHPASFRRYLRERFVEKTGVTSAHYVDGSREGIAPLTRALREAPIDLGLIGIGRNGHIAFNDPPADFETEEAYILVTLDPACRAQQVAEGWFPDAESVPAKAVSMTCRQILRCRKILSVVPYAEKAPAVRATLAEPVSPNVPATLLKTHPDWTLWLDRDSASLADLEHILLPEGQTCAVTRL